MENLPTPPIQLINDEEKDTESSEDLNPQQVQELLYPNGHFPITLPQFAVAVSSVLLKGWVKQPSPSCAAASVAGAWNAINGYSREDPDAAHMNNILVYYQKVIQSRIDKSKGSLERILGHSLDACTEVVIVQLHASGVTLGGKGDAAVKKTKLMAVLLEGITDLQNDAPVFEELRYLMNPEASVVDNIEEEETISDEGVSDEELIEDVIPSSSGRTPWGAWKWKKHLYEYYHLLDGLAKLQREKPSTAIIGNWGILRAGKELYDLFTPTQMQFRCIARTFMGKKGTSRISGPTVPLRANDTEKLSREQWGKLWSAFTTPHSALIFHLKNHYALIFALRQWIDEEGNENRQVLTARKGQRPNAWISWTEVRETLLRWNGHKIMFLCREKI